MKKQIFVLVSALIMTSSIHAMEDAANKNKSHLTFKASGMNAAPQSSFIHDFYKQIPPINDRTDVALCCCFCPFITYNLLYKTIEMHRNPQQSSSKQD